MEMPTFDLGSCLANTPMVDPHPNKPSNTLLHECASNPNPSDLLVASEPNVCDSSNSGRSDATEDSATREARLQEAFASLQQQAFFWALWGRNSRPWAFFLPNNNEPVVLDKPQVLQCTLCHSNALGAEVLTHKTRGRKDAITYNKAHGTIAMRKHVDNEHSEVSSRYYHNVAERPVNPPHLPMRGASKKQDRVTSGSISTFFSSSNPYTKHDEQQKFFYGRSCVLDCKRLSSSKLRREYLV